MTAQKLVFCAQADFAARNPISLTSICCTYSTLLEFRKRIVIIYSYLCSQSLLPRGCYRPICYAQEYQDSWKCNFLGLHAGAVLPVHVQNSDLHVCVDVTLDKEPLEGASANPFNYSVVVNAELQIPNKRKTIWFFFYASNCLSFEAIFFHYFTVPQVLINMWKGIEDMHLSDRVLEYFFISLKEEWMKYVFFYFHFFKVKDYA